MDGKYVKFFENKDGFIKKLEINGEQIQVYTETSGKNAPLIYPVKEKVSDYSQRLEEQYRTISSEENAPKIKKDLMNQIKKKVNIPTSLGCGISLTISLITVILGEIIIPIAGVITTLMLLGARNAILNNNSQKIDREITIIRKYLEHNQDIEKQSKKDPNVTRYLHNDVKDRIATNDKYKKDQLIKDIYDILLLDELLDKKKLKDLETLLKYYTMTSSLEQPQTFIVPEKQNETTEIEKTRIKKQK